MKLLRLTLALGLLAGVAGVAYVAQKAEPPAAKMAAAAERFVAALKPEQKEKAVFAFDSKERTNWNFVPLQDKKRQPTRKGLPLFEMSEAQKKLALGLLAAGTSPRGKEQAVLIMTLESILHELENASGKGSNVRDPGWYFLTVFGDPTKSGRWGWRLEGHHLSLNYTLDGGRVVASSPAFFGANPAIVKKGPKAKIGLETLPDAENLARELFLDLGGEQKNLAFRKEHFGEPGQKTLNPDLGAPQGLPVAQMTQKQKGLLMRLVQSYADRMPAEVAREEMKRVREGGVEKIHFAWTGGAEPGQPHTYRVHGPTFVIEFLNVQGDAAGNPANHIHSAWRRVEGDFGL